MFACRKPSSDFLPAGLTWLVLCLVCVTGFLTVAVTGADAADKSADSAKVRQYSLGYDLVGDILSDGSLSISTTDESWQLLSGQLDVNRSGYQRRFGRQPDRAYTHLVEEGLAGGHRGFSETADDDADGLVDEDPLDGLDNDGDGRIDEDFAAISNAMTVVGRQGSAAFHLEVYGWAYQHLSSALFTRIAAQADTPDDTGSSTVREHWHLTTSGSPWVEVDAISHRHTISGRPELAQTTAFVSLIENPGPPAALLDHSSDAARRVICDPQQRLWLGVVALNDGTAAQADRSSYRRSALVVDEQDLIAPVSEQPVNLAICVAPTWARLNTLLCETQRVYRGVTDPMDGRRARWIASALCSPCRLSDLPDFTWQATDVGAFTVTAHIAADGYGLIDPDLLTIGDIPLGSPTHIAWLPEQGERQDLDWSCIDAAALDRSYTRFGDPYGACEGLLDRDTAGRLVFSYGGTSSAQQRFLSLLQATLAEDLDVQIGGGFLDGRTFAAPLDVVAAWQSATLAALSGSHDRLFERSDDESTDVVKSTDPEAALTQAERQPLLAPELLENYPNPFRDTTWIRFRIPQTMGEAFVWEDDEVPAGLDLDAAIPWPNGQPQVSVKIYSMTGQELAMLHAAQATGGETVVQWSGTDSYGRPVASGTYFCKLQIDDWSVTKRLVFLR